MKIIDGQNAILGRLSSYVAKELLKGEEIAVINCEKIIITGSRKDIQKKFQERRGRVGSSLKGPRHSKSNERIVKRSIRGMLPDHRVGRGKIAYKRIKCYIGIPKEFENEKKIFAGKEKRAKFITIREVPNEKWKG